MTAAPRPGNVPVEVVVADKSELVLSGLKRMLSQDERFNLIATARDGERFLEAVDKLHFDVGVIGWVMPYLDGRGVLEALRERQSAPKIVVYTGSDEARVPREVMALGGAGFCAKQEPPAHLLDTVAAVAAGRMVFPFMDLSSPSKDPLDRLTPRERELLAALGSGQTNAQLARALGISENTVKFHLRNLYDKLQVRSRAQAVALHLSPPARSQ